MIVAVSVPRERTEQRTEQRTQERTEWVQADVDYRLHTGQTPLPVEPDVDRISGWSVSAHRRHWGWA
jgi:hypothetical protein